MRVLQAAIVGWSLGVILGCVAFGSSMGHVSILGSLHSATGEPLPGEEIQFIVPAAYGLGGLDLVLNKPADFGHRDRSFTVVTSSQGEFAYDLGNQIYHVTFWLLPPLGAFPRHPPPPLLLLRLPSLPGEYYAVQTYDGEFKVFNLGGAELPLDQAGLLELNASSESGSTDDIRWTVGIINLRLGL